MSAVSGPPLLTTDKQLPHTLSVIEDELGELFSVIGEMGETVRDQFSRMLEALRRNDIDTLAVVVEEDARIDALHADVSQRVVEALARNQLVARDLREVLACQRVALELERVGDHVKRIAKQRLKIAPPLPAEVVSRLLWFGLQVQTLLAQALRTYQRAESDEIERAWQDDAQLDRMYQGLLSELLSRMRQRGDWVDIGVGLVLVAKSLERIGDHATNIAEEARFVAIGEVLQARRSL